MKIGDVETGICACSRPATKKRASEFVCDSCLAIEARFYGSDGRVCRGRTVTVPRNREESRPREGEVTFKEWAEMEGKRIGLKAASVKHMAATGHYRDLSLRRVNARVVFVKVG